MKCKCFSSIETLAQLFSNRRVVTFHLKLFNELYDCDTLKFVKSLFNFKIWQARCNALTFSVSADSLNPVSPGRGKRDPAGKVWICRNISNPIRQWPPLWNIFKFNLPFLFHYLSKLNLKNENATFWIPLIHAFCQILTFFPLAIYLPGWKIATSIQSEMKTYSECLNKKNILQ